MKVFVTGVGGQLGYDVVHELAGRGHEAVGSDLASESEGYEKLSQNTDSKSGSDEGRITYRQMDITNETLTAQTLAQVKPDAVIHCAAWTAVDAAEDADKQETVYRVNADGTEYIAKACKQLDIPMLYLSTDYVFNGQGEQPWEPDCRDYQPLNVYGKSKLAGEQAVAKYLSRYFIVRIAWVFGKNGNNFIKTMLRAAQSHDRLTVVDDQIGTPTYTYDLARLLVDMIETDRYGYYHATNEGGYISWYEFAREIFRQAAALGREEYDEAHVTVVPVTTEQYGVSKASRPFNSRLDKSKLRQQGFTPLPDWQDAVKRYLREIEF